MGRRGGCDGELIKPKKKSSRSRSSSRNLVRNDVRQLFVQIGLRRRCESRTIVKIVKICPNNPAATHCCSININIFCLYLL